MGDVDEKIDQVNCYITTCEEVLNRLEQYKLDIIRDIDNYTITITRIRDHHKNDLEILTKARTIVNLDKRKKYWRDGVILRDHYTCQRCGSHDDLTVHHIIPKVKCDEDLRWSDNNGITLCMECHREWHDTYDITSSVYIFMTWLRSYTQEID